MTDRYEVIAAFADGEPVAACELKSALADEDGRDYLIDVLALRGLVGDAKPGAVPFWSAAASGSVFPRRRHQLPAIAAAALVVVSVAAGYAAGSLADERPVATDVVMAPVTAAPAPTHVIRMENGVNWNERAGGD